jgi:hypothetical protein
MPAALESSSLDLPGPLRSTYFNRRNIMAETTDWFQRGVDARIAGRPHTENPLLAPGEMPEITGEAFTSWRRSMDLWWEGWEAEDRRHSSGTVVEKERRSR